MPNVNKISLNYQVLVGVFFIIFGIVLRFSYLDQIQRTPDEHIYNRFASRLHDQGIFQGIRSLVDEYHNNPQQWVYPPPSRYGYYLLTYTTQFILSDRSIKTDAYVSIAASIIAMLIAACLVKILYGNFAFLIASILLATSSLSLAISRRNWTDSTMEMLMMALVALALIITKKRDLSPLLIGAFFIIGTFSFLIKESSYLNLALACLIPAVIFVKDRDWSKVIKLGLLFAATLFSGLSLQAALIGGFGSILRVYNNIKTALPHAPYAVTYQDGPLSDFIILSHQLAPGTTFFLLFGFAFYLVFLIVILKNKINLSSKYHLMHYNFLILTSIVTSFIVISSIPRYFKNLRYLSPTFDLLTLIPIIPLILLLAVLDRNKLSKTTYQVTIVCMALLCAYLNLSSWHEIIIHKPRCLDFNIRLLTECGAFAK